MRSARGRGSNNRGRRVRVRGGRVIAAASKRGGPESEGTVVKLPDGGPCDLVKSVETMGIEGGKIDWEKYQTPRNLVQG